MRVMDLPKFRRSPLEGIDDLALLIESRLTKNVANFPEQSLRLIAYMAWPNDAQAREGWLRVQIGESFPDVGSDSAEQNHPGHWASTAIDDRPFLSKLKLIQQHWARTADILHHHYDLSMGGHQQSRGGPSLSKAIHLVATNSKEKGTGKSKLWEIWADYKNVAHLITAALLVTAEANNLCMLRGWHLQNGLLQPLQVTSLLPDLVLAVAQGFQAYGLETPVHGSDEPVFDLSNLWRIPEDFAVPSLPPLARKIRSSDIVLLNARRAGHRGRP